MPRSHGDDAPATYLAAGAWPDGQLREGAPVSAIYAQEFSRRLRDVIAERGLNPLAVERATGVNRRTIERTLKGLVLPDFGALARLEAELETDLWPRRKREKAEGECQQTP
ncbi:transcriptional regulator [Streptomyces sp. NPDC004647]|uniref:helix-turn-helix domain-containing protein n=1 Tax=Streptomyces sp. NPDC004647 TaxID=3154671 RepID=UPI0033B9700D